MPPRHPIEQWSEEPYYSQLARELRRKIRAGEFRPGLPLPSESHLRETYGLSRWVVRRTLSILQDEGYTRTIAKRATIVLPPENWPEG